MRTGITGAGGALRLSCRWAALAAIATMPAAAAAQPAGFDGALDVADSGDTAWLLTSTALVLMMTLPGLSLFYGGLVRSRNALSVLLQCGAIAAAASLLWVIVGYTLAFGAVGSGWVGGGNAWMLIALGNVREGLAVPESAFALFQMTFAVITPALMVGAWAERARFGWVLPFTAVWGLLVYAPVAHWLWGGGWLAQLGVRDFAGGIVVHVTAGVSALVAAMLVGRRDGWPKRLMLPHSPALTLAGGALLWVGWIGFNGGSALAANDDAAAAVINTHVAASLSALVWLLVERLRNGRATSIGFATGAIAGLATITPAAGYVSPGGAMVMGLLAAPTCYLAIGLVKNRLGIDDSLDVFAVHGVGGVLGSLLLAVFAQPVLGGTGFEDGASMAGQFGLQLLGIAVVALWSAVATVIAALSVSMVVPMRVSEEAERDGLDITGHGERGWDLDGT